MYAQVVGNNPSHCCFRISRIAGSTVRRGISSSGLAKTICQSVKAVCKKSEHLQALDLEMCSKEEV